MTNNIADAMNDVAEAAIGAASAMDAMQRAAKGAKRRHVIVSPEQAAHDRVWKPLCRKARHGATWKHLR